MLPRVTPLPDLRLSSNHTYHRLVGPLPLQLPIRPLSKSLIEPIVLVTIPVKIKGILLSVSWPVRQDPRPERGAKDLRLACVKLLDSNQYAP
jgi:hypothetical protein